MKLQKLVFKILTFCFFSPALFAQSPAAKLARADSLFTQQAYTEALPLYQEVLQQEKVSPAMLLRMAYIQEGLGRTSEALYLLNLYYRKTSNEAVISKIQELAGQHDLSGYEYVEEEYLRSLIRTYQTHIVVTLLVLCIFLMVLLFYRRLRLQQRMVLTPAFLVLLLAVLFYFINFDPQDTKGILVQNNTYLMKGPSAGAGVLTQLKAGHRLEVLGQEDVWIKVVWNDQIAWVKADRIREV